VWQATCKDVWDALRSHPIYCHLLNWEPPAGNARVPHVWQSTVRQVTHPTGHTRLLPMRAPCAAARYLLRHPANNPSTAHSKPWTLNHSSSTYPATMPMLTCPSTDAVQQALQAAEQSVSCLMVNITTCNRRCQ
jgi:hypothetical protein